MGLLQSYSLILFKYPGAVLTTCSTTVLLLFFITTTLRPLQSFSDPLIGFEARNTQISARINAWKLLTEENSANANNISLVPNSFRYDFNYQFLGTNKQYLGTTNQANMTEVEPEPPIVEMSTQQVGQNLTNSDNSMLDEFEDEYYQMVNATLTSAPSLIHYSLDSSQAFCGKLYEGYAQVVISSSPTYSHLGLFNLNSLLAICQLDHRLRLEQSVDDHAIFHRDCEQYVEGQLDESSQIRTTACCNSWSLPNHLACLSNKTSCMQIDTQDLKIFEQMIKFCAPYYYKAPYEECFTNQPKENESTQTASNTTTAISPSFSLLNPVDNNLSKSYCGLIPDKCLKCGGWIFNVLHYLTNENFIRNRPTQLRTTKAPNTSAKSRVSKSTKSGVSKDIGINKLTYTNLFLPIAKSSSLLRYYHALSRYKLKTPYAQVKVLNLGLKNSLFEHLVSADIKLFAVALVSILIIISVYTWSFFLSLTILMIICLSLCLSYTIYELILNIPIFPFMNLLAVVISFGICSDNAMLFCKQWTLKRDEPEGERQESPVPTKPRVDGNEVLGNTVEQVPKLHESADFVRLNWMLKRAVVSTFAATFATACSFLISAISQVTAVRCFCIFATLSVITNYMLTILLLPSALILDSRFRRYARKNLKQLKNRHLLMLIKCAQDYREKFLKLGDIIHQEWIFKIVMQLKLYLIITFVTLLICASIVVFKIGLQPSDDDDVQLLSSKHEFEQYDRHMKKQFAFERAKHGKTVGANVRLFQELPETLPIRVVFGIKPVDNGNHYDPLDRGHIVFDDKFNFADEDSQNWMLDFCHKLRQQRFVHPTLMLEVSSCFIDTFKSWMESRPCKDPVQLGYSRTPCCQAFEFPYSQYIFDKCIGEALSVMRKTPHLYPNINAGVRFHKNSSKIAALIVEFSSNRMYTNSFTKMEMFYHDVNEWVSWQINNTAPPGMKSGWFISNNIELLALQTELDTSTNISVLLEIIFAMLALSISTHDLILTLAGTLTIVAIIVTVVATLILLRWTLGVAESILISLTIGLSIDFALHYSVAYSEGLRSRSSLGVIQRILSEVGSPIALATVTTSLSGFVIVWSDILAYQELGIFLLLIALISWLSSTFFLLPMLAVIDALRIYSERYFGLAIQRVIKIFIDRV